MKIHFLTSAHNSFSQRLLVELTQRGHTITVAIASSEEAMVKSVEDQVPHLIIAPMLTKRVPESIWSKHTGLVVHPGILGDRGPSSLDWAIAMGERSWGVSILQAVEEMDSGPICATRNFSLDNAPRSKSSLYRHEVPKQLLAASRRRWRNSNSSSTRAARLQAGGCSRLFSPAHAPERPRHRLGPRSGRSHHKKNPRRR